MTAMAIHRNKAHMVPYLNHTFPMEREHVFLEKGHIFPMERAMC